MRRDIYEEEARPQDELRLRTNLEMNSRGVDGTGEDTGRIETGTLGTSPISMSRLWEANSDGSDTKTKTKIPVGKNVLQSGVLFFGRAYQWRSRVPSSSSPISQKSSCGKTKS